jgi:hypothetical protein
MTREEMKAKILDGIYEDLMPGPPKPKPRPAILVCVNGVIVGDAVVIISEKDVNWWRGMAVRTNGVITVRKKMTTEEIPRRA